MNPNTPIGKLTQSQLQSFKHYMSLQIRKRESAIEGNIADLAYLRSRIKSKLDHLKEYQRYIRNQKKSLALAVATQKAVKKALAGK